MAQTCLLATLGEDPHTQGLFRVARIARRAGLAAHVLHPGTGDDELLARIRDLEPAYLGFSYRLSPAVGIREFERVLGLLHREGLLGVGGHGRRRRIALAGLPETMAAMDERRGSLPCPIWTIPQRPDPLAPVADVLGWLEVDPTTQRSILDALRGELYPPRIAALDELAREVAATDDYRNEPPLPVPSAEARGSYVARMRESDMPLLRTHFGIPDASIEPTVLGIERLAEARVVDEVSLGSSDLSQRHFGHPEAFEGRKNDGGVPYRTEADLAALQAATQRGNFPAIKPYAHVVDLVPFIDVCLRNGLLRGGHQAVPLYWFNELDGRGPHTVGESIREHVAAVRELARQGLPVEMNDPNQWSSRWAHDTVIAADYALITAVMLQAGVRDLVLQLQFNKPRETGDHADLAKMTAGLALAGSLLPNGSDAPRIHRETRAGIDAFDPDLDIARLQLARTTLLQMLVSPAVIHLVSYCEALHAATADDVIDSSRLVRRAVRVFRQHAPELRRCLEDPAVTERRDHLVAEATTLLREVAAHPVGEATQSGAPLRALVPRLASPEALQAALERGVMAAPGIFHPRYAAGRALVTGPNALGGIDSLDPDTGEVQTERARLDRLRADEARQSRP